MDILQLQQGCERASHPLKSPFFSCTADCDTARRSSGGVFPMRRLLRPLLHDFCMRVKCLPADTGASELAKIALVWALKSIFSCCYPEVSLEVCPSFSLADMVFPRALLVSVWVVTTTVFASPLTDSTYPIVTLDRGTFIGTTANGTNSFLGIPFAHPPSVLYFGSAHRPPWLTRKT
jgi:hypothetical protein